MISTTNMPTNGELIDGRYLVEGKLGAGGFGVVFRAKDQRTGADVAVKVLDPARSENEKSAARFRREIDLVARLQHPNTIRVTDCGETQTGCLYLVMELLRGKPLDEVLKREGRLAPSRVTAILEQVLRSLAEAHAQGIVHRDLKPENVFLATIAGESDFVKVLDFGIAKGTEDDDVALTASNEIPCSPRYVAPERITQNETTPAGDVYSLGVMTLELLTGRPPYDVDNSMGLLLLHADPTNPVPIPDELKGTSLGTVLARAVDKDPAQRFINAGAMLTALTSALPNTQRTSTRDAGPSLATLESPTRSEHVGPATGSANARVTPGAASADLRRVAAPDGSLTQTDNGEREHLGQRALRAPRSRVALAAAVVIGCLLVASAAFGLWLVVGESPQRQTVEAVAIPVATPDRAAPPSAEPPVVEREESPTNTLPALLPDVLAGTSDGSADIALADRPVLEAPEVPAAEPATPSPLRSRRAPRVDVEAARESERSTPRREQPEELGPEATEVARSSQASEPNVVPTSDEPGDRPRPTVPEEPSPDLQPEPTVDPTSDSNDWGLGLQPR